MDLCKTEQCTGCTACMSACPNQCIRMVSDCEGFLRPVIDTAQCTNCGICRNTCPILHPLKMKADTAAYAAMNKDDSVRMTSTSGGVFSLLCQWVFHHGGFVFGAVYSDDFSVEHRCIQSILELPKLRTAKYSQSELGNSLQIAKNLLDQDEYVLFSGTPCQIGGLQAFLGKKYEKLILVDVICHGVPSPAVWKKYIEYRSTKDAAGAAPSFVNLRSKKTGWPEYSVRFDYHNNCKYFAKNREDPFLRSFVGNLCLRPSCYDCQFKGVAHISDFTLGDYWGVWSQLPEFHDGKGTSLVLVHTEKARVIWNQISDALQSEAVSIPECLKENSSALQSPLCPPNRNPFLGRYADEDFEALVNELLPLSSDKPLPRFKRAVNRLKRIIHLVS